MLFCANVNSAAVTPVDSALPVPARSAQVAGFRLPVTTADAGKVRLGGGFRLPAATADCGKIRLGGGFRLPAANA